MTAWSVYRLPAKLLVDGVLRHQWVSTDTASQFARIASISSHIRFVSSLR